MSVVVDKFHTYDSAYIDDEVRGLASLVTPSLTTFWDLLQEGKPVESTRLRWFDAERYGLEGTVRTTGWNNTDLVNLRVDDDLAAVVNVGDLLLVDGSEYVVVSNVSSRAAGAATIDVHARGHGGSTPASYTGGESILIVSSAHVEGTVDGESLIEDNAERVQYTQIIEEPLQWTKTAQEQRYEDVNDKKTEAREKALVRALKKLNLGALLGVPAVGTKTTPRSAGGLRYWLESNGNAINSNIGGALTEAGLANTLIEIRKRGGMPNVMLCSVDVKNTINGFNRTTSGLSTQVGREERVAGTTVDYFEFDGIGRIALITDPLLVHGLGEAYILNTRKSEKMWFKNDALRFEQEPANSRSFAETLQGQFTVKFKDTETDFARLYGIT